MATIPCTDCKFHTERVDGFRKFVGCSDPERKKGFHEDDYFYHHSCDNYEPEKKEQSQ